MAKKVPSKNDAVIETIYQAYPRKVGKKAALVAIYKALQRLWRKRKAWDDARWLLTATQEFAASPAGQQGKGTPHPASWFNAERYYDDRTEWYRGFEDHTQGPGRIPAPPGKYDDEGAASPG